ncbi:MAG: septal ring lytic transglycosylase RlpA family protein [Pseudomonadota bacterium]
MRKANSLISAIALLSLTLSGCSLLPGKKPFDELADGPGRILQPEEVLDAVPTDEPFADLGNKSPYSVNGRFYYVMEDPTHYRARGVASWYGKKFHGRKTSSGEVFDMYSMTAAHRNLPLPTYLEVTNLDNGEVAIVRVNDRGPFVDDRLIDLSYAAAVKLGLADAGTANVEVRAITGDEIAGAREIAEASAAEIRETEGVQVLVEAAQTDDASVTATAATAMVTAASDEAEDTAAALSALIASTSAAATETAESGAAEVETAAATTTAAVETAAATAGDAAARVLQLGAFSKREGADSVRDTAMQAVSGVPVRVLQAERDGAALFRVRMGPVAGSDLDAVKAALAEAGLSQVTELPASAVEGDCVAGCV